MESIHNIRNQECEKHILEFCKTSRLDLEIGVGKGRFTKEYAMNHPERLLLGIEKTKKYLNLALEKIQKNQIKNVMLIWSTAQEFMTDQSAIKFENIWIMFPDPWPKKRHHKRRLINPENLEKMNMILNDNGKVHFVTDHEPYFNDVCAIMKENEWFEVLPLKLDLPYVSNFQAKYNKEGRAFYYLIFKKRQPHQAHERLEEGP